MQQFSQIMWYVVIIAAVGVGSLMIALWATRGFRKRLGERGDSGEAFTLQEIRQMLAEGKITRAEYEGMRAVLIGRMKGSSKSDRGRPDDSPGDEGDGGDPVAPEDPGENPK
jgi:hypothetical protein